MLVIPLDRIYSTRWYMTAVRVACNLLAVTSADCCLLLHCPSRMLTALQHFWCCLCRSQSARHFQHWCTVLRAEVVKSHVSHVTCSFLALQLRTTSKVQVRVHRIIARDSFRTSDTLPMLLLTLLRVLFVDTSTDVRTTNGLLTLC